MMFKHTPDHVYSADELADKLHQIWEELIYCRTAADTAGWDDVGHAIGRCADPLDDAKALLSMKDPNE